MVVHLSSPDGSLDQLYISNYATLQIRDVLARLDGVGDVQRVRRARLLDAHLARPGAGSPRCDLTAGDVVNALRAQNVQVASGALDQPPVPTRAPSSSTSRRSAG